MLNYPNAAQGVKKLYVAEILSLIGSIILGAGIVFGIDGLFNDVAWMALLSVALIGAAGVLLLISFINNLVGLSKASKDDQGYKVAFWMMIISMILSIIFCSISGVAKTMVSMNILANFCLNMSTVLELLSILLAIRTTEKLLVLKGDAILAATGEVSLFLMIAPFVVTVLLRIITFFTPAIIDTILNVVATVVQVFGYLMYLSFLSAAKIRLGSND